MLGPDDTRARPSVSIRHVDRLEQGSSRGLQVLAAEELGVRFAARFQAVNVVKVFLDGRFISLFLRGFVPLVMVVEDHRDHVVKVDDEAVVRGLVDEAVEAIVEV